MALDKGIRQEAASACRLSLIMKHQGTTIVAPVVLLVAFGLSVLFARYMGFAGILAWFPAFLFGLIILLIVIVGLILLLVKRT